MIIKAASKMELAVFLGDRDEIAIAVVVPGIPDPIVVRLDVNHAEALETAIRAARLEAEARAKSLD